MEIEKKVIEFLDKLEFKNFNIASHRNLIFEFIFARKVGVVYSTVYIKPNLTLLGRETLGKQILGNIIKKSISRLNFDSKHMSKLLNDRKIRCLYEHNLSKLREGIFGNSREMLNAEKFKEEILKKLVA